MVKVLKITNPECKDCMGASFGDCAECETKTQEVTMCMNCRFNDKPTMWREKTLCTKLHAWVEPYEFCAWGKVEE